MADGEDTKIFPDQPWWTLLVAVIVTVLSTLIAVRASSVPGSGAPASAGSLITDTALFFPHALILFGILADMFTYQGVYSIPSVVGIIAIFANKVMDYFWSGIAALLDKARKVAAVGTGAPAKGGAVLNYKGCYVQGFEVDALKSVYSSQTLVVTATILSYYILDLVLNKGIAAALASIIVGGALFFLQMSSMSMGGCFEGGSMAAVGLTSLANGVFFGGISYGIVQAYYANRLPSAAIQPRPPNPADLTPDGNGRLCDKNGNCFKDFNGSLTLDTCTSSGSTDSSGDPATAASCAGGNVNQGAGSGSGSGSNTTTRA